VATSLIDGSEAAPTSAERLQDQLRFFGGRQPHEMLGPNQQRAAVLWDAAHHTAQLQIPWKRSHAIHTSLVSGTYQSFRAACPKLAHTVLYGSPSTHGYTLKLNPQPFTFTQSLLGELQ
jgi:hypothetical protein